MADSQVKVTLASGEESVWNITENLTDRWGELNDSEMERKHEAFSILQNDPAMLESLVGQMVDEVTFVARKDGVFGILFEAEFCTKQSEMYEAQKGHADAEWYEKLPHETAAKYALCQKIGALEILFPKVQFAVVGADAGVYNGRLALWAFAPSEALNERARELLGSVIFHLYDIVY